MSQTIPATCVLGPGLTGLTIGLRVLNLDGTTYAAFATTDVAETSVAGTYRKAGGVVAPLAGGYIVWGTALVDYAEATVESASVNVTLWNGDAVAAADADGYIPVDVQKVNAVATAADGLQWLGDQADDTGYIDVNVHQWRLETVNHLVSGNVPVSGQAMRDAMMLAPTAGAPGAGSVDEHLDAILEDTGTTLPAAIAAIDTSGTAEAVWEYTTRTLTQSSTSTTDSTAAGSIARRRGDSWSISLTIGAITGYTSLWFTAKWDRDNTDAMAVLQIKKNASGSGDGLLYVNGATAANAALASITVTDATTGAIVIAVDETVTDDLPPAGIYYDVQVLNAGSVSTLDSGTLIVSADVTRAVA